MDDRNELQTEIENRLTAFFRNWERYAVASDLNPHYLDRAEDALRIATRLAQVEQAAQLKRIADAMEKQNLLLSGDRP